MPALRLIVCRLANSVACVKIRHSFRSPSHVSLDAEKNTSSVELSRQPDAHVVGNAGGRFEGYLRDSSWWFAQ